MELERGRRHRRPVYLTCTDTPSAWIRARLRYRPSAAAHRDWANAAQKHQHQHQLTCKRQVLGADSRRKLSTAARRSRICPPGYSRRRCRAGCTARRGPAQGRARAVAQGLLFCACRRGEVQYASEHSVPVPTLWRESRHVELSREFVQGSGLLGLEGWTFRPQITPQPAPRRIPTLTILCSLYSPCLWPKERAGRVALPPPPMDRCVCADILCSYPIPVCLPLRRRPSARS